MRKGQPWIVVGAIGIGWAAVSLSAWGALKDDTPNRPKAPQTQQEELFRYDPAGRRDPFIPLIQDGRLARTSPTAQLDTSKPVLYGILWDSSGRSLALINDTEVTVGDMVSGYHVREIRQDAVVLLDDGGHALVLRVSFDAAPPGSAQASDTTQEGGEGR